MTYTKETEHPVCMYSHTVEVVNTFPSQSRISEDSGIRIGNLTEIKIFFSKAISRDALGESNMLFISTL